MLFFSPYGMLVTLFIFASDVVAGVYGESGTGGRHRALTVSMAREADAYLASLARPSS